MSTPNAQYKLIILEFLVCHIVLKTHVVNQIHVRQFTTLEVSAPSAGCSVNYRGFQSVGTSFTLVFLLFPSHSPLTFLYKTNVT